MSSSAPSTSRQSAPAKVFLVVILGLGCALAGIMFFGPGGGLAATRAGILPGASPSAEAEAVAPQLPPNHDTTMAAAEATQAGRRGNGAALATAAVDGTAAAQAAPPQAVAPGTALAMNSPSAAQIMGGQYQQAPPGMAQPMGATPQQASAPVARDAMASQPGLNPFLVPAVRQPAASTGSAGYGSAALAPTAAYPSPMVPAASAPTAPGDNSGSATGVVPSGISGAQNLPALPLPLPQPSAPASPFGLRCGDIPWDENSMRMGLMAIGAMVLHVSAGSEAAQAGLNVGDRIVRAGGQPVVSAPHFFFLTTQPKGGPLELEVLRGGVLYRATLGNPMPR